MDILIKSLKSIKIQSRWNNELCIQLVNEILSLKIMVDDKDKQNLELIADNIKITNINGQLQADIQEQKQHFEILLGKHIHIKIFR